MVYSSITEWIQFLDPTKNPEYPYSVYNLPYDIGYKLSEVILGLLAWLINVFVPGNCVSTWLIDPMVLNGLTIVLMVVVIFAVGFVINLTMIWEERKVLGRLMDRRATRIGPLGYFQCLADGLKTFMKENVVPKKIDKKIYWWALALVIGTSVLIACMVPLSQRWFIVDYGGGLLIIFGLFALAPFLILCAGWAQNNKYSLIGGMRAAELMISYEIPMLIIFASAVILCGSYNINDMVNFQNGHMWFVIPMILGFFTFFVCAIAESERVPFDLSEAEAELVEGWQTEYAGMKWGLIMLGDYFRGYVACALIVIIFLAGWLLPSGWCVFDWCNQYIPEIIFILKVCLVFFVFAWARGALPRVRTDQILNLGWKVLLPLSVINLVIVILIKTYSVGGF